MSATTSTPTWPDVDEYEATLKSLVAAFEAVEQVKMRIHELFDVDVAPSLRHGVPPITVERLGLLTSFEEKARLELDTMTEWLNDISRARYAAALECQEGGVS